MILRRLNIDLRNIEKDPPLNVIIDPISNDNPCQWHGAFIGPLDTPYENGIFRFKVEYTEKYPFEPLKIQLLTKIFHPNVFPNGFICMDILHSEWSASYSLSRVLLSFVSLLSDPEPTDPSNPEAAHYYRSDREKYHQMVRDCTKEYATDASLEAKINTAKQAIMQDLNNIETNQLSNVNIRPLDMKDLFYWQGTIQGPENSPYVGTNFTINIRFPLNYPERAPSIIFRSVIYHPNIFEYGIVDFPTYSKADGASNFNIINILQDLFTLLSNPNCDCPSNSKAAKLYRKARETT